MPRQPVVAALVALACAPVLAIGDAAPPPVTVVFALDDLSAEEERRVLMHRWHAIRLEGA